MATSDFGDWYLQTFGKEFPLPGELRPTHSPRKLVWVSQSLADTAVNPPLEPVFFDQPDEYILAGHWGYGTSSWALYYVLVTQRHRCFFRLAYGNHGFDRGEEVAYAVAYLEGYRDFRTRWLERVAGSTLVHDTGGSSATISLGTEVIELSDTGWNESPTPAEWWRSLDRRLESAG